jgi:bla regulator protein blaR1
MKTAIGALRLTAIALTLSLHVESQTPGKPPSWMGLSVGSTKSGVSQALLAEYLQIVSKYNTTGAEWWKDFEKTILPEDRTRLEQIYQQMSVDQQNKQKVAFIKTPQPLKKVIPSDKEVTAWKNENVYGVWIDGKKINNFVLDHYANSDFEQVNVSKLYGAAKRNKKYAYQVNLMTKAYYRRYYEQTIGSSRIRMVFRD